MKKLEETLSFFNPSPIELLDILRVKIDQGMLKEIAEADYGWKGEENMDFLIRIRDKDFIPTYKDRNVQEVLELTRWSEPENYPENPNWKTGATIERGHWIRLFCCTILIKMTVDPNMETAGINQTIVQFLESALALNKKYLPGTLSFLSWAALKIDLAEEQPFLLLAILILSLHLLPNEGLEKTLYCLTDVLIDLEEQKYKEVADYLPAKNAHQWLLRLSTLNIKHEKWKKFIELMLKDIDMIKNWDIKEKIELVGKSILK